MIEPIRRPATVAGSMENSPETVYHFARSGTALGQKPRSEALDALAKGELQATDLAWCEGMGDWKPVSTISDLSQTPSAASPSASPFLKPSESTLQPAPQSGQVLRPVAEETTRQPLASLGARFLGAFVDGLIMMVVAIVPMLAIDGVSAFAEPEAEPSTAALIAMSVCFLVIAIIQLTLLARRGQTIGKIVARTRIHLNATGEQAGLLNAFLLRGLVGGLPGSIPLIGSIYTLVDICFIFREDRRCIHDLIGGTMVLKAD